METYDSKKHINGWVSIFGSKGKKNILLKINFAF